MLYLKSTRFNLPYLLAPARPQDLLRMAFLLRFKVCPKWDDLESDKSWDNLVELALKKQDKNYLMYYLQRAVNLYNEYALLIIQLTTSSPVNIRTTTILALSSVSLSLANGAADFPTERPGTHWSGKGGEYGDEMLRASLPFLLSALINLSVLGKQTTYADSSWPDILVASTSQGYLFCFCFCLICLIQNTSSQLLNHRWLLRKLFQFLVLLIIPLINAIVLFTPQATLEWVVGVLVFYGGTMLRFVIEPFQLKSAWKKSNLGVMISLFNTAAHVVASSISSLSLDALRQWYEKYVKDEVNTYLYFVIFLFGAGAVVAFTLYDFNH